MEETFNELVKKYRAEVNRTESSWFNGHAYMPLIYYRINFYHKDWNYVVNYEYRGSEFNKSQAIDGGTFNTRHIYSIFCSKIVDYKSPKFRISESDFLRKLFINKQNYILKCKDSKLSNLLNNNIRISEIYNILDDNEFSPYILGQNNNNNKYEISLRFNTKSFNRFILSKMINTLIYISGFIK